MDGTDVDKDTITDLPEKMMLLRKPVGCTRVKVWSEEPYYRGTIKYDASLRERGSSFDNYSFASEKMYLKRVPQYTFMKKFKIHKVTFGVEHIHQVTMVVHKHTIEVEETYKSRIEG